MFVYLMYAVATGTGGQDPATMEGLMETFHGWDALLRDGYVVQQ